MKKKLLSLLIALAILSLTAVFPAGAVLSAPAGLSARDDANQPVSGTIYFDNSTTKWDGPVQFYVYDPETGEVQCPWGSAQLNGTYLGDNIWAYQTADHMHLKSGKQYCIIFCDNGSTAYTHDLLMDSRCFNDIAYATGKSTDGAYDSKSSMQDVKWSISSLGTQMLITMSGEVVGETCPAFTSTYQLLVDFLSRNLSYAREYSGKDDQALLDDLKKDLGLSNDDVTAAIEEAGVFVDWSPTIDAPIPGDADGDGEVTSIDATYTQRFLSSMSVPESFSEKAADIDGDKEVSSLDVTYIQRYLAHISVPYPIGS